MSPGPELTKAKVIALRLAASLTPWLPAGVWAKGMGLRETGHWEPARWLGRNEGAICKLSSLYPWLGSCFNDMEDEVAVPGGLLAPLVVVPLLKPLGGLFLGVLGAALVSCTGVSYEFSWRKGGQCRERTGFGGRNSGSVPSVCPSASHSGFLSLSSILCVICDSEAVLTSQNRC